MTAFETELIRAIEHGCPECTGDVMIARMLDASWYDVYVQAGGEPQIERDWHGTDVPDEHRYIEVRCDCRGCKITLWTAETGWVPELQEIVKGE